MVKAFYVMLFICDRLFHIDHTNRYVTQICINFEKKKHMYICKPPLPMYILFQKCSDFRLCLLVAMISTFFFLWFSLWSKQKILKKNILKLLKHIFCPHFNFGTYATIRAETDVCEYVMCVNVSLASGEEKCGKECVFVSVLFQFLIVEMVY